MANKEYFVNQIREESTWNKQVIGLFTKCRCYGNADCQSEYYYNTTLLAKYEIIENNIGSKGYEPKKIYQNYTDCNKYYKKVNIGSGYWTGLIVGDTVDKARTLFKQQKWDDIVTPHRSWLEYTFNNFLH